MCTKVQVKGGMTESSQALEVKPSLSSEKRFFTRPSSSHMVAIVCISNMLLLVITVVAN
jgi:hypothetical protein